MAARRAVKKVAAMGLQKAACWVRQMAAHWVAWKVRHLAVVMANWRVA